MADSKSEAEDRDLDAQCTSLRSLHSCGLNISELKGLTPSRKALCIVRYAQRDLPNLIRCAVRKAGISADTRWGDSSDAPVLCLAAARGSARSLSALLDGLANITLVDSQGHMAAHCAAGNGHAPCLRLLLDAGAPKEARDTFGYTSLHLAASSGHAECCSLLLASGCAVDVRKDADDAHSTPLFYAAVNGHEGAVRLLMDAGARLEARDRNGSTLLFFAVSSRGLEVIKLLLACGANPDAINDAGDTPLMHAATLKSLSCMRELLPFSNLSITNKQGLNVLHQCVISGNLECFDLLLPVMNLDTRTVQCIAADGTPSEGLYYETPLHLACLHRQLTMMRRLLRNGASRTARDSAQRTPLHRAAQSSDMGSLVLILGEPWLGYSLTPAEVNAADANGWTPLHWAAFNGHARICGVLLAAGASLNAIASSGGTPLKLAQLRHPANAALLQLLSGHGPAHPPGTVCDGGCGTLETDERLYICARCSTMRFCCDDCFRVAWPAHKEECGQLKAAIEARS